MSIMAGSGKWERSGVSLVSFPDPLHALRQKMPDTASDQGTGLIRSGNEARVSYGGGYLNTQHVCLVLREFLQACVICIMSS